MSLRLFNLQYINGGGSHARAPRSVVSAVSRHMAWLGSIWAPLVALPGADSESRRRGTVSKHRDDDFIFLFQVW